MRLEVQPEIPDKNLSLGARSDGWHLRGKAEVGRTLGFLEDFNQGAGNPQLSVLPTPHLLSAYCTIFGDSGSQGSWAF